MDSTEKIIQSETTGWVQEMRDALASLYEAEKSSAVKLAGGEPAEPTPQQKSSEDKSTEPSPEQQHPAEQQQPEKKPTETALTAEEIAFTEHPPTDKLQPSVEANPGPVPQQTPEAEPPAPAINEPAGEQYQDGQSSR